MTEAGIPAEDARFVLPNAAASSMVASLNLRELIHIANKEGLRFELTKCQVKMDGKKQNFDKANR